MLTARDVALRVGAGLHGPPGNKIHPDNQVIIPGDNSAAPGKEAANDPVVDSPRRVLFSSKEKQLWQEKLGIPVAAAPPSEPDLNAASSAHWLRGFTGSLALSGDPDGKAARGGGGGGASVAGSKGCRWRAPLINPHDQKYQAWWFFTMGVALITAALDPYRLAFEDTAGFFPYTDVWAGLEYAAILIFMADMATKFFLAYSDPGEGLVTSHKRIFIHYLKFLFWVDLISTFPIDGVVAAALGLERRADDGAEAMWLGLVRWLRLLRLYRIFDLFDLLEHKMVVSQLTLILLRNNLYALYITHWFACLFYWVSQMEELVGSESWVKRNADRWEGQGKGIRYLYSLYFSVSAFAGLGDGDFFCQTAAEMVIMIVYLLMNIVLQAYILGTITMVVVKSDEKSRAFRDRMENLKKFSETNALPDTLTLSMREHLEMQFNAEVSDDLLLADYPATLRRKALRHLYADCLQGCALFKGTRARFLDQVLVACRSELFMPNVAILSEGDVVSELMIVVDGQAQGLPPGCWQQDARRNSTPGHMLIEMKKSFVGNAARRKSVRRSLQGSVDGISQSHHYGSAVLPPSQCSTRRGSMVLSAPPQTQLSRLHDPPTRMSTQQQPSIMDTHRYGSASSMAPAPVYSTMYEESDIIGAVPFFTDTTCIENVHTTSMCRVIIISKTAWDSLSNGFPQQVRVILENLKDISEAQFLDEVEQSAAMADLAPDEAHQIREAMNAASGASFSIRSRHRGGDDDKDNDVMAGADKKLQALSSSLPPLQRARLEQIDNLRSTVNDFTRKQKAMRVYEFLLAAAQGDLAALKALTAQGVRPGSADYDRRNALMVAAHEGQDAAVKMLLGLNAPLAAKDAFGNTALSEAVMQGHDHVVQMLVAARAPLGMEPLEGFGALCRTVIDGDAQALRRLLFAGAQSNWPGFDGRTALHVAASEGNLQAAELLVEYGKAFVDVRDRWGTTPCDDAREAGHMALVDYLAPLEDEVQQGLRPSWQDSQWHIKPVAVQQTLSRNPSEPRSRPASSRNPIAPPQHTTSGSHAASRSPSRLPSQQQLHNGSSDAAGKPAYPPMPPSPASTRRLSNSSTAASLGAMGRKHRQPSRGMSMLMITSPTSRRAVGAYRAPQEGEEDEEEEEEDEEELAIRQDMERIRREQAGLPAAAAAAAPGAVAAAAAAAAGAAAVASKEDVVRQASGVSTETHPASGQAHHAASTYKSDLKPRRSSLFHASTTGLSEGGGAPKLRLNVSQEDEEEEDEDDKAGGREVGSDDDGGGEGGLLEPWLVQAMHIEDMSQPSPSTVAGLLALASKQSRNNWDDPATELVLETIPAVLVPTGRSPSQATPPRGSTPPGVTVPKLDFSSINNPAGVAAAVHTGAAGQAAVAAPAADSSPQGSLPSSSLPPGVERLQPQGLESLDQRGQVTLTPPPMIHLNQLQMPSLTSRVWSRPTTSQQPASGGGANPINGAGAGSARRSSMDMPLTRSSLSLHDNQHSPIPHPLAVQAAAGRNVPLLPHLDHTPEQPRASGAAAPDSARPAMLPPIADNETALNTEAEAGSGAVAGGGGEQQASEPSLTQRGSTGSSVRMLGPVVRTNLE